MANTETRWGVARDGERMRGGQREQQQAHAAPNIHPHASDRYTYHNFLLIPLTWIAVEEAIGPRDQSEPNSTAAHGLTAAPVPITPRTAFQHEGGAISSSPRPIGQNCRVTGLNEVPRSSNI